MWSCPKLLNSIVLYSVLAFQNDTEISLAVQINLAAGHVRTSVLVLSTSQVSRWGLWLCCHRLYQSREAYCWFQFWDWAGGLKLCKPIAAKCTCEYIIDWALWIRFRSVYIRQNEMKPFDEIRPNLVYTFHIISIPQDLLVLLQDMN